MRPAAALKPPYPGPHVRHAGWPLWLGLLAAGCGSDAVGEPLCIPGKVEECTCIGGATGVHLCLESGRFDSCSCLAPDAAGDGASGQAGQAGQGGDGTSDPAEPPEQDPPEAEAPDEGALWGACRDSDDCRDDRECAGNRSGAFGGSGVGYCTERCRTSSGPGGDNQSPCPSPDSGNVEVICSRLSTLCELATCEGAQCPAGMRCQELRTRFGTSFECGYE